MWINLVTWVLASDTDSALVEAAHAFLYLSIVALTLQIVQAIVEILGQIKKLAIYFVKKRRNYYITHKCS